MSGLEKAQKVDVAKVSGTRRLIKERASVL